MTASANNIPVITLDGPGGAGKGTLAGLLARELGWELLDSGALYRVLGWYADAQGLSPDDDSDVATLADAARTLAIAFESGDGQPVCVRCRGRDITEAIRSDSVSAAASRWAALAPVRQALLTRQRAFRTAPGLVADGRDMGTVVFPDAPLKFFVTASAAERAERRYAQMAANGDLSAEQRDAILARIYNEIVERDERDASRAVSPLKPAADGVTIDTTGESVAASLDRVRGFICRRGWL